MYRRPPQIDEPTKEVTQTFKQYLRNYCSYQQDNWVDLLPLAEYAYNSDTFQSSKFNHLYANYGYQPETVWPPRKSMVEQLNPIYKILEFE